MSRLFKRKIPNNEKLIELVQKEAAKLGRAPLMREFEYSRSASSRFGNWGSFLAAAGLEPAEYSDRGSKLTHEELIDLLQEQAEALGRAPQMEEFEHKRLVKSRYGSWTNFLKQAGLVPGSSSEGKGPISNKELLALVKKRAKELGRRPKKKEFNYSGLAEKRYGSWTKFLESAGLKQKPIPKKDLPTNKELMELVKKRAEELGYRPTKKEFEYSWLAEKRYGNWTKFLEKSGLKQKAVGKEARPTNEELLELVKKRAEELGQTPKGTEFEYYQVAVYRYGTWRKFLKSAKLEPRTYIRITQEELVSLVQKQAKELGEAPRFSDFPHKSAVLKRYGTWNNFLESAGIELRQRKLLSNQELIDLVQKQAEETEKTPTAISFPHLQDAVKQFGSWNNFLRSAGLKKDISDEELFALVQERASELGYTPALKEFDYSWLATKRFGTWRKFLQKAGLKMKSKKRMSDEHLIELVREKALEIGRSPLYKEFELSYLAASRFGTWNDFLERAGLEIPNKRYKKRISNKELIKLVKQQAKELGRNPRKTEFEFINIVKERFGTWDLFLQKAGLGAKQYLGEESFRSWLGKERSRDSKSK